MSKVSLVLISMNEEDFVPKFLESLKRQTRKPDEIILIDSSTDRTPELMKSHVSKVIYTPPKGCGHAREIGVKNSSGDILVFTDIDSILDPMWLEEMTRMFEDDKVSVVQGQVLFNSFGKEENTMWSKGLQEKGKYICGCNMAFRREVLEKIHFDSVYLDDIDIGYRVSKKYIIYGNKKAKILHYGASQREKNSSELWKRGVVYYTGWMQLIKKYKHPYWVARMLYNILMLLLNGNIKVFLFHVAMLVYVIFLEMLYLFKVCISKIFKLI
jgi:glycosyltransferase involved in cell wall biosynthesis